MTIAFSILIAVLLAENICVGFYLYFRPDRAIRAAEKEKHAFLCKVAMQTINRNYGIAGAPAMDDEFDDPENPVNELSNRAIDDLMPDEAQEVLTAMEAQLDEQAGRKHSGGPIERRRELVSKIRRLKQHIEDHPAQPKKAAPYEAPYIGTLEPEQTDHLGKLIG